MAFRLPHHMLLNHEQAAIGARDRTLDQQQVSLRISLNHLQFLRRHTRITHVAGHACSLEYTTGGGAGAYRTRGASTIRLTVSLWAATKTVAFNTPLEALPFRGADYIDRLASCK